MRNTELKRATADQQRLITTEQHARQYAEHIVAMVPVPLLTLDPDLRVQMANRAFYQMFQLTRR